MEQAALIEFLLSIEEHLLSVRSAAHYKSVVGYSLCGNTVCAPRSLLDSAARIDQSAVVADKTRHQTRKVGIAQHSKYPPAPFQHAGPNACPSVCLKVSKQSVGTKHCVGAARKANRIDPQEMRPLDKSAWNGLHR
jgi:hypothetical protein